MKLIEEVEQAVSEFVDQDEATVLIVRSRDEELAPVVHCIHDLDSGSPHVFFLSVAPVGNDLVTYVESVLAALFDEMRGVEESLREDGLPVPPPFPEQCRYRNIEPMIRLRMAFAHLVTAWLPDEEDHLVVALLPSEVRNLQVQAQIVGWLLPQAGFEPWMIRTRLIVRDDKVKPFVVDTARNARSHGVVYFDTHLTAADHVEALLEDANDPELESGQRMSALLQCATVEVSLGRLPQAMEKFVPLYHHYETHGLYQLQGLILLQVAEAFRQVNSPARARNCLLGALDLSTQNSDPSLMLNSAHGLATMAATQGAYQEMESACSIGIGAAMLLGMHDTHVDLLVRLGDARAAQANWVGAVSSWTEGAKVARENDCREMLIQVLGRFHDYASRAGQHEIARQYAAEIQQHRAMGVSR